MFHTLLVAIDGGPQTRRIAELARQAAAPGARVHLLCAVDAGYALPGRPTLLDYLPPRTSAKRPGRCSTRLVRC